MTQPSCGIRAALAIAVLAGCGPRTATDLSPAHALAITDSVRQLVDSIATDLAREGPNGWLAYFTEDPGFYMAYDGQVVFPDRDSAAAVVRSIDGSTSRMEIVWSDLRIDPLAPGRAAFGTAYRETVADTAGVETHFSGYFTAVAIHEPSGWRLNSLHWSSPPAGSR